MAAVDLDRVIAGWRCEGADLPLARFLYLENVALHRLEQRAAGGRDKELDRGLRIELLHVAGENLPRSAEGGEQLIACFQVQFRSGLSRQRRTSQDPPLLFARHEVAPVVVRRLQEK